MNVPANHTDIRSVREKYRNVPEGWPASGPEAAPSPAAPVGRRVEHPATSDPRHQPVEAASQGAPTAPPARVAPPARRRIDIEVTGARRERAKRGWRAKLNALGLNLMKGEEEIHYDARVAEIRRTPRVAKRVGVVSGKGGSGKTSVTLNLGMTIAKHNAGINVAAMSIDPLGNINRRVSLGSDKSGISSVATFANDEELRDFNAVISHMADTSEGLRVLGSSGSDEYTENHILTSEELERSLQVLAGHFSLTFIDFGLDYNSDVYHTALRMLDGLVFTSSTTVDAVSSLIDLVDKVRSLGGFYLELVQNSVVVLNQTRLGKDHFDIAAAKRKIEEDLGLKVLVTVPFDEHIAEGGPIKLDLLNEETRLSFVYTAAEVMKNLG